MTAQGTVSSKLCVASRADATLPFSPPPENTDGQPGGWALSIVYVNV